VSKVQRSIFFAVVSLMLGGAAAADISARERKLAERIGPLASVLVTAQPIAAGGWVTAGRLAVRTMPRRWIPAGVLTRLPAGERLVAASKLPAGAMLGPGSWRSGAPSAAQLANGQRATTVVASAPVSSLVSGGKVDVLSSQGGGRPRRIVAAAELLAWRSVVNAEQADAVKIEADLVTTLDGAVEIAAAGAAGGEIRLLPIGEG